MARRVLFWAYASAREVVEFPDGATDAEVDEELQAWLGNIDSGWNDVDDEGTRPPDGTDDEVGHGMG